MLHHTAQPWKSLFPQFCVGVHAGDTHRCTRQAWNLTIWCLQFPPTLWKWCSMVWDRVSLVMLNTCYTVSSPCLKPWHLKVSFVSVGSEPPLPPSSLLILLLLPYGHKPGTSQDKRDRIQWVSKCQILLHSASALNRKNLITTFRKSWAWMGYALKSGQLKCILKAIVPHRLQISLSLS